MLSESVVVLFVLESCLGILNIHTEHHVLPQKHYIKGYSNNYTISPASTSLIVRDTIMGKVSKLNPEQLSLSFKRILGSVNLALHDET